MSKASWPGFLTGRRLSVLVTLALPFAGLPSGAQAGERLESIRELDLNTHALGAHLYMSGSPYDGVDDFVVVFPAPTRYDPAIVTDEAFFIRDGDFGLRTRVGRHWDVAGVLAIQGLGYGSGQSPALAGMSRRNWTVQGGVSSGRDLGKYRFDIGAQTDLLGEHDGQEYELKLARLFRWDSFYLLPQVEVTYQSSDLVNHYFGVTAAEAIPGRPQYQPGAAVTWGTVLEWGWKWHSRWFVSASAKVEWLPSEIRNSPVVSENTMWSFMTTLAYDAPSMVSMDAGRPDNSGFEFNIGAFLINAESKVFLVGGGTDVPVDIESDFSIDDAELSIPVEFSWRINPFHRIDFGYFELKRSGAGDVVIPVDVGNTSFGPGDTVNTGFDTRIFRFGYAFSLLHDAQKELAIFGGAHISDVSFRADGANDEVRADTTAILPVLGADLQVNFTDSLSLGTKLQFFVSDVNRYSGNLIDFSFFGKYTHNKHLAAGFGYRYYRQDIDTADEDFFGDYRFEYRGPFVFIGILL